MKGGEKRGGGRRGAAEIEGIEKWSNADYTVDIRIFPGQYAYYAVL